MCLAAVIDLSKEFWVRFAKNELALTSTRRVEPCWGTAPPPFLSMPIPDYGSVERI
jgi:hypothetical protein